MKKTAKILVYSLSALSPFLAADISEVIRDNEYHSKISKVFKEYDMGKISSEDVLKLSKQISDEVYG